MEKGGGKDLTRIESKSEKEKKILSCDSFRSSDLRVMSPARFRCATQLVERLWDFQAVVGKQKRNSAHKALDLCAYGYMWILFSIMTHMWYVLCFETFCLVGQINLQGVVD